MRVCVVGGGSIGCYLAARIASKCPKRNAVTVVNRPRQGGSRDGVVRLLLPDEDVVKGDVQVSDGMKPLAGQDKFDVVFVTVKRKDTIQAAMEIEDGIREQLLDQDTAIISLQNGMGNVDIINQVIGGHHHAPVVLQGVTYIGASLLEPLFTQHKGVGKTFIGVKEGSDNERWRSNVEQVAKMLYVSEDENCSATFEISPLVWTKLLANTVINPLTAITNQLNGALLEERYQPLVHQACMEFQQVAEKEQVQLLLNGKTPTEFVNSVCKNTAPNTSSMLLDINNKHETEIEAINGYVVRLAQQHHIEIPIQTSFYNIVKTMQR
uniref:2-dehydropantoate 2-reductase n=1 Tax=Mucochytrium quahogii TaxID=96639 RepID=A0A7S2SNE0_9STRA|mmetsp:Transcript_12/g.47  ORF Transcript_12/g.47 Transcript_12/m.47 type:complete len:323 (+) Transcript_12:1350-2318(+)